MFSTVRFLVQFYIFSFLSSAVIPKRTQDCDSVQKTCYLQGTDPVAKPLVSVMQSTPAPLSSTGGYSWNRLHVGHTKETSVLIGRRGTELPWKQTALPPQQMVVVRVSGAGCITMAGSRDDYLVPRFRPENNSFCVSRQNRWLQVYFVFWVTEKKKSYLSDHHIKRV